VNDQLIAQVFEALGELKGQLNAIQTFLTSQQKTVEDLEDRVSKLEHGRSKLTGIIVAVNAVIGIGGFILTRLWK